MKLVDSNVRYLCETFPDSIRRLVLKAQEVRILTRDEQALRDLGERMQGLREQLVRWCSDQNLVLEKLLRHATSED